VAGYSRIEDVRRLLSPKGFLIAAGGAWAFFGLIGLLGPVEAQTPQGRIGAAMGVALLSAGLFLPSRLDRGIVSLIGIVALFVEFLNLSAVMLGTPVVGSDHVVPIAIGGPALWIAISGGLGER
jgi:hypothetical protein